MFNEHLKRIRISAKKNQESLAKHLCISTHSVSKWEKGTSLPSLEMLPEIADFYGCTVNAFFSEYELEIFERINASAPSDEDITKFLISLIPEITKESSGHDAIPTPESSIPKESLFLPAVYEIIGESETVSAGTIQRKLGLGYGLAARIVEALTELGIAVFNSEKRIYEIKKEKIHLLEPYLK